MYWNSVSTFGALLHFQYLKCEEIVYFSIDFSSVFILNILYTEDMADLQTTNRYFHCAILKTMYWNSVSTFGALLQFQYLTCEEIVYVSMDCNPDFAQYILYTDVAADKQRSNRYFHCAILKTKYWNSVSTFGALLHFQYLRCEEIVYFSMDFSSAFILNILYTEDTADLQTTNQYFHCAIVKTMYWN